MSRSRSEDTGARLVLGVGIFLSVLFLKLGVIGLLVLGDRLVDWFTLDTWPTAEASIVSGREETASSRPGRPTYRAVFEWVYRIDGAERRGAGHDLVGQYVGDRSAVQGALAAYPVGSSVRVFVDPKDPGRSVLARGPAAGLVILLLPPLFVLLGFIGAGYTIAGALGTFDVRSQGPIARSHRAMARWFLRQGPMKLFVYGAFGVVITALAVYGIVLGDVVVIGLAGFVAYGLWVASKPRRR